MTVLRPRVWLVLPDPFSSRLFFDTGIVEKLHESLGDDLELFLLDASEHAPAWRERAGAIRFTTADELTPGHLSLPRKLHGRADRWLDDRVGFYPLALRLSLRQSFNHERMQPGHQNWFLDPERAGPLPQWSSLDPVLMRWHYGRLRYMPPQLESRLRWERPALVLANTQMQAVVPFIVGGRRLQLPLIGHIASWDHTVGKGIVPPDLRRYIVQNDVMRDDLVRFHGIERDRIVVTGWPQTDVFHERRPRAEYEGLLQELGLDPTQQVALVMGNTPTNAPYERRFVERLVGWWEADGMRARFSLLFRPHPRDREWRERFAPALSQSGTAVQEASFTDIEALATLLEYGDVVVSNAGTILLDALVNDRPAVCVLYDEGAPSGESWALKNVSGDHYRALMDSRAFYRAESFDDVVAGIERALADPGELASERARVAREVVGEVDGHAADRVAEAVLSALG
jgi:CDP-Glycerol:Poly(glycerophosphate) glycerophosphotransferase